MTLKKAIATPAGEPTKHVDLKPAEVLRRQQENAIHLQTKDKIAALAGLSGTDKKMARVAEDIIALLIAKGVLEEDDLPQSVRDIIASRKELRGKL